MTNINYADVVRGINSLVYGLTINLKKTGQVNEYQRIIRSAI